MKPKENKTKVFVNGAEMVPTGWKDYKKKPVVIQAVKMPSAFQVDTLEGRDLNGKKGDWLLRGVEGELYPCRDRIFRKTYQKYIPLCKRCKGTGLISMEDVACDECEGTGKEKKRK